MIQWCHHQGGINTLEGPQAKMNETVHTREMTSSSIVCSNTSLLYMWSIQPLLLTIIDSSVLLLIWLCYSMISCFVLKSLHDRIDVLFSSVWTPERKQINKQTTKQSI